MLLNLLTRHFGNADDALRFCRRFSGITLDVPAFKEIERVARQRHIVRHLTADPSLDEVRRVSDFLGIHVRDVSKTYRDVVGEPLTAHRAKVNGDHVTHPAPGTGVDVTTRRAEVNQSTQEQKMTPTKKRSPRAVTTPSPQPGTVTIQQPRNAIIATPQAGIVIRRVDGSVVGTKSKRARKRATATESNAAASSAVTPPQPPAPTPARQRRRRAATV